MASPSPVPPFSRERLNVDPVETLGQAGERALGDALAIVAHADRKHLARVADRDPDMALRAPIFDRVVDEILEQLDQFVAVAGERGGPGAGNFHRNAVGRGEGAKRRGGLAHDAGKIDLIVWRHMLVEFDAG